MSAQFLKIIIITRFVTSMPPFAERADGRRVVAQAQAEPLGEGVDNRD
jgi:hypothetical protein